MKIIDHLNNAKRPPISFEIVPPKRGKNLKDILNIVDQLVPFDPPFIDVTSHASSAYYKHSSDGLITRKVHRKRPGTLGICGVIQNRYNIDTVAHVLCTGFTQEETEDALIELNYLGIHNILALRGDESNYRKVIQEGRSANSHASSLIQQIMGLCEGRYLDDDLDNSRPMEFGIGVAGYPEKHFEAPNMSSDLKYLKQKIDMGAEYIITQMFYDNQKYFDFVNRCRAADINVPIVPGIKVINKTQQLKMLPKIFHIDLPDALVQQIEEKPQQVKEIGVEWAIRQGIELLEKGAPCLHFYVFDDCSSVVKIVNELKGLS